MRAHGAYPQMRIAVHRRGVSVCSTVKRKRRHAARASGGPLLKGQNLYGADLGAGTSRPSPSREVTGPPESSEGHEWREIDVGRGAMNP